MNKASPPPLDAYPLRAADTIRYADTDRQGHVNNAAFATFCETGRCALLFDPRRPLVPAGTAFVIARLLIEFLAEVNWPGQVEIGTRVLGVGRSSFTLGQGLFQAGTCVATAESVIVQMDEATRRSKLLAKELVQVLEALRGQ
jgi:acyl-CoA thioester hydrolase